MLRSSYFASSLRRCFCGGMIRTQVAKSQFSIFPTRRNKEAKEEDESNKPVQFSTSEASKWKAVSSLGGGAQSDMPDCQPYIVVFSVGMFMLYFFVLREESDIDREIEKPLWEKVPSLEKQQLRLVLDYNKSHNLDTGDIERRLKEIEVGKMKSNVNVVTK